MSLRLVTPFINTSIPGAYPNITVQSLPVGLGNSGIVVIMGEADGGNSYQNVQLKNNFYTADQLPLVQQLYTSGQIVNAFSALAAPSDDPGITGSANLIYIVKTNQGTQASSTMPTDYGIVNYINWGIAGNNYTYQVTTTQVEEAPTVTGAAIPSLAALDPGGTSFTIRLNGGIGYVVSLPAGTYTTGAQVAAALTGFPSGVTASGQGTGAASSISINVTADSNAYLNGWGKSFELIDSTPGDLAALGLVAALDISAEEPAVEVLIANPSISFNETLDMSASIAFTIGYETSSTDTATITINATTISSTVTGGSGASFSIPLSQFPTLQALASYINTLPGYSASAIPSAQQLAPSVLDRVTAIGIASTGAGLEPGRIKDSAYSFALVMNTSTALAFTPIATAGLPAVDIGPIQLTGGTRGVTLAADIVNALEQMAGIQCNIIVPLFSQDASADITAGVTSVGSTYTIEAINALTKSHCIQYSTPALKHNRICILSYLNTYQNDAAEAQSLGNYRCSLTMQSVVQVNTVGVIETFQPWYAAVLAAGMQAGGFYKSICNKAANVISYVDPSGFDSGSPGDVEAALSAGLLFFSQDTGRAAYWVSDQTTYGFDTNFVYNSIQAVYCSDLIALDLAQSFFQVIVGQSEADIDASAGLTLLAQKMAGYKQLKLIAASSDAPLGYKNQSVSINGPTMTVNVEIKLATAIYFVPISINISQIMNSAS